MESPLSGSQKRALKARAQLLEPSLKLGHGGVSPGFLASLQTELARHELVKIKFTDFKDEKKVLAPQIAEATHSELVMRVGNVAVYFRPKTAQQTSPDPAQS